MKKYLQVLKKVALFSKIGQEELILLLPCVGALVREYEKNQIILLAGDEIKQVGIVLSGNVQVMREDMNGNRNLLAQLGEAAMFAEVFTCAGIQRSPVTVVSDSPSEVLFIDFNRIISQCQRTCSFHTQLIENMLKLIAGKNLYLNEKIDCIGRRSIRERVEVFLMNQQVKAGANPFHIPFSRVEMADYLCVDRSALSAVLGKLRDEGKIRFHKNCFEILEEFGG